MCPYCPSNTYTYVHYAVHTTTVCVVDTGSICANSRSPLPLSGCYMYSKYALHIFQPFAIIKKNGSLITNAHNCI